MYAALNKGNIVSNPYTLAKYVTDKKQAHSIRQAISLVAKLSPKVTATAKASFDYQRTTRDNYYPINTTRGRRNNGEASQAFSENNKLYLETNVRFRKRYNKHLIDAILLGTYEQNNIRTLFNKAIGYGSDLTTYYNFDNATENFVPVTQFREVGLLSSLARIGYNYKGKYFIDVNARIDASSKFAKNKKSAFFPSVALSWVASKEKIFRASKNIDLLKWRLSYGKTGSNPITPYQSLALMTPIRYNFNDQLVTGFYESNLANDNLTWENTNQFNTGIDLKLFDSALQMTLDSYYKRTENLLQNVKFTPFKWLQQQS